MPSEDHQCSLLAEMPSEKSSCHFASVVWPPYHTAGLQCWLVQKITDWRQYHTVQHGNQHWKISVNSTIKIV